MLNCLVYEMDRGRMLRAGMSKLSHYMWTVIDRLCKGNALRKRTQCSHESAKLEARLTLRTRPRSAPYCVHSVN